jgi:hypothetical protein
LILSSQVTKRIDDGGDDFGDWENWNWRSSGDMFENGAFFTDSGTDDIDSSLYAKAISFSAKPSSFVASLTAYAGVLQCGPGVSYLSFMALFFCIDHVVIDIYKNAPTNVPVQVLVQMILVCFFKVRDGNNSALLAHTERERER